MNSSFKVQDTWEGSPYYLGLPYFIENKPSGKVSNSSLEFLVEPFFFAKQVHQGIHSENLEILQIESHTVTITSEAVTAKTIAKEERLKEQLLSRESSAAVNSDLDQAQISGLPKPVNLDLNDTIQDPPAKNKKIFAQHVSIASNQSVKNTEDKVWVKLKTGQVVQVPRKFTDNLKDHQSLSDKNQVLLKSSEVDLPVNTSLSQALEFIKSLNGPSKTESFNPNQVRNNRIQSVGAKTKNVKICAFQGTPPIQESKQGSLSLSQQLVKLQNLPKTESLTSPKTARKTRYRVAQDQDPDDSLTYSVTSLDHSPFKIRLIRAPRHRDGTPLSPGLSMPGIVIKEPPKNNFQMSFTGILRAISDQNSSLISMPSVSSVKSQIHGSIKAATVASCTPESTLVKIS